MGSIWKSQAAAKYTQGFNNNKAMARLRQMLARAEAHWVLWAMARAQLASTHPAPAMEKSWVYRSHKLCGGRRVTWAKTHISASPWFCQYGMPMGVEKGLKLPCARSQRAWL